MEIRKLKIPNENFKKSKVSTINNKQQLAVWILSGDFLILKLIITKAIIHETLDSEFSTFLWCCKCFILKSNWEEWTV